MDDYTVQKLTEYQHKIWEEQDRRGIFRVYSKVKTRKTNHAVNHVRFFDRLYGFFRKRRSRKAKSL
ncbi:hypothetical protein M3231_06685 [Neobacillus mesonae]|nr:hypothetical protein [Neobacillus mesonae]